MNKEKIITVIIGITAGVIVTGGYFVLKNLLPKQQPTIVVQPFPKNTSPPSSETNNVPLTVDQPIDKSSTSSATITISGKTAPSATLFLFSNAGEKIASADASGNFNSNLKLEDGENEISVTAFLDNISPSTIHRNVTLEISQ